MCVTAFASARDLFFRWNVALNKIDMGNAAHLCGSLAMQSLASGKALIWSLCTSFLIHLFLKLWVELPLDHSVFFCIILVSQVRHCLCPSCYLAIPLQTNVRMWERILLSHHSLVKPPRSSGRQVISCRFAQRSQRCTKISEYLGNSVVQSFPFGSACMHACMQKVSGGLASATACFFFPAWVGRPDASQTYSQM